MAELGLNEGAVVASRPLTREEVCELVAMAGGDAGKWGAVIHLGSGGGHPQLAHAAVLGLAARGWPREALVEQMLGRDPDILRERETMRGRLTGAVPPEARALLYRSSLVRGRLPRRMILALGEVSPAVERPGEVLDRLVGPWIDSVGSDAYRVSPLVGDAGQSTLSDAEKSAVDRAVVDTLLADGSLSTDVVDTLFLHSLRGERMDGLFGLALSIVTADARTRRAIAAQSIAFRHLRTDRPAYPQVPAASKLLRLAQVHLSVLLGDDRELVEIVDALLAETSTGAGAPAADVVFEGMTLFKLLLERRIGSVLRGRWLPLLVRFHRIASTQPVWRDAMRSSAAVRPGSPPMVGLLFATQCSSVSSVAELEKIFDGLSGVDASTRDAILAAVAAMPGGFASMVNHGWVVEGEAGTVDWLDAASRYLGMAAKAADWGRRDLAVRCHAARAVMLDEYGRDPDAAYRALDEAVAALGTDPVLSRSRAKVLWRGRDHAAALPLLEEAAAASLSEGPVERTFLLREAAISAAELGDWTKAASWFAQGRDAADETGDPMASMAVGLEVDAAVAAWRGADAEAAIQGMARCLDRLSAVDPDGDVKGAYVHRIVRHAVLWMHQESSGRRIRLDDGGEIAMPPGAGSNPEPRETIRDIALADIDVAWYVLAAVDLSVGQGHGAASWIPGRLVDGPIPGQEIMLAGSRIAAAISRLHPGGLAEALAGWAAAKIHLGAHRAALTAEDVFTPARGRIPELTATEIVGPEACDAIAGVAVAFGMAAAVADRQPLVDELSAEASARLGATHPALDAIVRMRHRGPMPFEGVRGGSDAVAFLAGGGADHPDGLLLATVRLIEATARSDFRRTVERPLCGWIARRWRRAVETQGFTLGSPRVNGPAILRAVKASSDDLVSAARIAIAALPAVQVRFAPAVRKNLQQIADQETSP